MEHEAFVPVPAEPLRQALGDPARVARAIPGLQRDATDGGGEGVAGRLKLRIAGHTITYRGTLRLTRQSPRDYTIEGDATEARGTGSVKLALALRLSPTDDGTTLTFSGTATTTADGRTSELDPSAIDSATRRLLNRCATALAAEAARGPAAPAGSADDDASGVVDPAAVDDDLPVVDDAAEGDDSGADDSGAEDSGAEDSEVDDTGVGHSVGAVFDAEVPPPSLSRYDDEAEAPPAEAAHARRTMIGRSAEEVDHAPPRGRYAPIPAPATSVSASDALRWAAPAAALVVASAIVAGRILRRRR
ncbi:SRPBCC family protein [Streptomyces apocyni]|uniref:SRPBCC family protein n=1 Tax=Streptomyces apocyni TaxID=2654677 RepID=UPI0012EAF68B|nr:SRPBCC family protein [Streptomyces apocyni]